MRRRRGPEPTLPPLGGIVVDGANVIANAAHRAGERLQAAVAWLQAWRPDLPNTVFVDHATFARCDAVQQARLRAAGGVGAGRARLVLCPPPVAADVPMLQLARTQQALVVSNDRFFDHVELRANVVTVQFELRGGVFTPHAEATWFRTPGHARRVPMAQL
jgi:hypothetical protein